MDWKTIEQEVAQHYPYPLARRFLSYFGRRVEGMQNMLWTYRLAHDAIQYLSLILVADSYHNHQLVGLLPHYSLRDWIELLERQLRTETLRTSQHRPVVDMVERIQGQWANAEIDSGDGKIAWYATACTVCHFPPVEWDEEICRKIVFDLCTSLAPLQEFSLGWAGEDGQALCLRGVDQARWQKVAIPSKARNRLVLYNADYCCDLFPFFLFSPGGRSYITSPSTRDPGPFDVEKPEVWMWDGDNPREKKIFYHAESRDRVLSSETLPGYQDCKLAKCIPDSSYTGLLRTSSHQVKTFVARYSQSGRYSGTVSCSRYEAIAEINNFIAGKFARAAIVAGKQGTGKTNLLCHLVQQWSGEGHLTTVVEACDIKEETLSALVSRVYGKNHSWNLLLKEASSRPGRRCIIVIIGIEQHPETELLLDQLQEFLRHYQSPVYPIRTVLVGDIDFLSSCLAKNPVLLAEDLLYSPLLCASRNYPFMIEIPPLTEEALEKAYLECDDRPAGTYAAWSPGLKRRMRCPQWLKLLTAGAGKWHVPNDIKSDEILYNFLDQNLWEYPAEAQMVKAVLPLFTKATEISVDAFKSAPDGWRKSLDLCIERGILQERINLEGEGKVSFTLPILRDFLIARDLFSSEDLEFWQDLKTINYNAARWVAFHFLQHETPFPAKAWEKLLAYPEILAGALVLLEEIHPITMDEGNKIIQVCRILVEQHPAGVESLISFLKELGERRNQDAFSILLQFMYRHRQCLVAKQLLPVLELVETYAPQTAIWDEWSQLTRDNSRIAKRAAHCLSKIHYRCRNYPQALAMAQKAIAVTGQVNDPQESYQDWQQLADCHYAQEDYANARECYEKILQLAQQLNDAMHFVAAGYQIAAIHEKAADPEAALNCYNEILGLNHQLGNVLGEITALRAKAALSRAKGRLDDAAKEYQQAFEMAHMLSAYPQMAEIAGEIASLNENGKAASHYRRALRLARMFLDADTVAGIQQRLADRGDSVNR